MKALSFFFCLLLVFPCFGEDFLQGVSSFSSSFTLEDVFLMKELGGHAVSFNLPWRMLEPELTYLVPVSGVNNALVEEYSSLCDWSHFDETVYLFADNGFVIIPWLCHGLAGNLPLFEGEKATPNRIGPDNYLGAAFLHARAVVRRYKNVVDYWLVEGELNASFAASIAGWRTGGYWAETKFIDSLLETLCLAVRTEDPTAMIGHSFHTDIPEEIFEHDWLINPFGLFHWSVWLNKWKNYIDFVGIDAYPNYYWASPPFGGDIAERVSLAKEIAGKPVIVTETAYPAPAPNLSFFPPVDYTEEKQAQFALEAYSSAKAAGAEGFFWFNLTSPGMTGPQGGYSEEDLEVLSFLGTAFRAGDAELLEEFIMRLYFNPGEVLLLLDPERDPKEAGYSQGRLAEVLSAAEKGWGLVLSDGIKRPSFFVLQECFGGKDISSPQIQIEIREGWNLISLPVFLNNHSREEMWKEIDNKCFSLWHYDQEQGWLAYFPEDPLLSDLEDVELGKGYWINARETFNLYIQGYPAPENLFLEAGTHMIGWPSLEAKPIEEAIFPEAVFSFESGWLFYSPEMPSNTLEKFEPGKGYFIFLSKDDWLIVE